MTYFIVDTETDGPAPGLYSMVSFGVVIFDDNLEKRFFGEVCPISDNWIPKALKISRMTRTQTLTFPKAEIVIPKFVSWVKANTPKDETPRFVSDNTGFDFGFMNYYLWRFAGENPFGHSSRNISDLYKGMKKDLRSSFKKLRGTKHTHHPIDDVVGNGEALLAMRKMGLHIPL